MQLGDPQITLPSRTFRQKKSYLPIHKHFSFPFSVFFFLALGWPDSASSILFCFEFLRPSDAQSTRRGNLKNRVSFNWVRALSVKLPTRVTTEILSRTKRFRVGRPSVAVCRTRIQILTEKMHSSNSFEFGFLADHREKAN